MAFSDEHACINVLYEHVGATLGIDDADATSKVDARATDIDLNHALRWTQGGRVTIYTHTHIYIINK